MTYLRVNNDITIEKIAKTISRLSNNTILRLNKIPNKAIKTYKPLLTPWLIDIAKACFVTSYYPRLKKAIIMIILYKEGKADYLLLKSYRFIALENTLNKILKKVIINHIANTVEKHALLT